MTNDYINISSIETHLESVLRKNVCGRCYVGTLPSTLTEGALDMVVIDVANTQDLHAYGSGIVNIYLYAQPINGLKNVATLSKLEKAFKKCLDNDLFDSEHYVVPREFYYQDDGYDTTYNMHFIIKAIHLTIR